MIVLFLAYFLQTRIHQMDDWKGTVLRAALPPLVFIALILKEPDLGTALVCAAVTVLMLYLAGHADEVDRPGRRSLRSPVMYYMLFHVPWRRARMIAFINPEADPLRHGLPHHAVAHRGRHRRLPRAGPDGRPAEALLLPEPGPTSSSPTSPKSLASSARLLWSALFVHLGYRGLRAAFLSTDPFARFLAFGLTTAILIQAFFNISVVARAGADQGHHAAVHLLRRHVAVLHAGRHGRAAEHHPRDRLEPWRCCGS